MKGVQVSRVHNQKNRTLSITLRYEVTKKFYEDYRNLQRNGTNEEKAFRSSKIAFLLRDDILHSAHDGATCTPARMCEQVAAQSTNRNYLAVAILQTQVNQYVLPFDIWAALDVEACFSLSVDIVNAAIVNMKRSYNNLQITTQIAQKMAQPAIEVSEDGGKQWFVIIDNQEANHEE